LSEKCDENGANEGEFLLLFRGRLKKFETAKDLEGLLNVGLLGWHFLNGEKREMRREREGRREKEREGDLPEYLCAILIAFSYQT